MNPTIGADQAALGAMNRPLRTGRHFARPAAIAHYIFPCWIICCTAVCTTLDGMAKPNPLAGVLDSVLTAPNVGIPTSCPCTVLPLLRTTRMVCSPLTTWLLVTMSPFESIMTPEPICCPCDVVTSSSTTAGSIFAMAASCCVSMVFALDEEPFDCACEVDDDVTTDDVVPVLLWLLANCQPANRPTPKMAAITSVRSTIAAVRPVRLR